MLKGDTILYGFGFKIQEAKIIKVYDEKYIQVRHKDAPFFFNWLIGYKHIIPTSSVISVKKQEK